MRVESGGKKEKKRVIQRGREVTENTEKREKDNIEVRVNRGARRKREKQGRARKGERKLKVESVGREARSQKR